MSYRIWLTSIFLIALVGCVASQGVYHRVERGQTFFTISRIYKVDPSYLARINGIEDPSELRAGQRIFIPGTGRARYVPATVHHPAKATSKIEKRTPPAPIANRSRGTASATKKKPALGVSSRPPPAAKGLFIWPIRGEVVRSFGRHGNQTCQGLEIAAPGGSPVLSAAAGRVTYSGNDIRGYGHLVIVRHDGDFFTVYGFNKKSLVEAGVTVRQGERIALSGAPPGDGRPRLHFEIRRGKSPVDPIFYLP